MDGQTDWGKVNSELLCLCRVEILKNLPVHLFNAFIIPILRDCLPNCVLVPRQN